MIITYAHRLTQDETYKRGNTLFPKLEEKYPWQIKGSDCKWSGDNRRMNFTTKVNGFEISGHAQISEGEVTLEAKLPLALKMLEPMIEGIIRKEITQVLSWQDQ